MDSPLSAQHQATVQAYLYAQTALVDLVQKVEEVDSMIGKMPPACETYLNIESFVFNETKRERDLRISGAAARMIKLHLRSWTNVMDGSAATYGYRIFTEVMNTTSISNPSTETALTEPLMTDVTIQNPATGSRSPSQNGANNKDSHSIRKSSSIASIRPGNPNDLKPSLKRKKSVTWDPSLDKKHGTQGPSIGRHEPHTERPPLYNDHILKPGGRDPAVMKALDAIQFEYWKLRPSCLNLLDPRSALLEGYSHEREYRQLTELLMANVLERLDNLSIDPHEESSRRKRKEIATDASGLLQLMDKFILDHRNTTAPGTGRSRPPQDEEKPTLRPRETGSQRPLIQKHPMIPPSETSNPSRSPCLGHKILTVTLEELLDGGFRTLYIPHPPFHSPRLLANFYLRIPPASVEGDHVRARLLHRHNTTEQLNAYFDVELVLDEISRGARRDGRRRSRSICRLRGEDVPDICFCEDRPDCCAAGSGWRHARSSRGSRESSYIISNKHADDWDNPLKKNGTVHKSKKPRGVCNQEDRGGGVRGDMGSDGCDCRDCCDCRDLRCAEYNKRGRRMRRVRNPRPREDRMQAWPWLGISLR
jgi:hypothetical protein